MSILPVDPRSVAVLFPGQGGRPRRRRHDDLGEQRVVVGRDAVPREDVRVHPHPGSAGQDDGGDFDFGSEDFIFWTHAIFASFRTALQATARTGPLLLALDHLSKIYQPDVGDFMVPGLLAPIGGRELPKVQLVIVGRNEWLDELRSTDPSLVLPPPIRVPMFSWRKIEGLGREYVARQNRLPVNDRVIRILREMQENQPPEFTGDKLQTTLSAIGYVA